MIKSVLLLRNMRISTSKQENNAGLQYVVNNMQCRVSSVAYCKEKLTGSVTGDVTAKHINLIRQVHDPKNATIAGVDQCQALYLALKWFDYSESLCVVSTERDYLMLKGAALFLHFIS